MMNIHIGLYECPLESGGNIRTERGKNFFETRNVKSACIQSKDRGKPLVSYSQHVNYPVENQ